MKASFKKEQEPIPSLSANVFLITSDHKRSITQSRAKYSTASILTIRGCVRDLLLCKLTYVPEDTAPIIREKEINQ
jgi:hypothetical protein